MEREKEKIKKKKREKEKGGTSMNTNVLGAKKMHVQ